MDHKSCKSTSKLSFLLPCTFDLMFGRQLQQLWLFYKSFFCNVTFCFKWLLWKLWIVFRGGRKQRGQAFIPLKISNQDFKSRRCENWNDLFIRMILETRIFWSPSNNISQQQQIDTNSQFSSGNYPGSKETVAFQMTFKVFIVLHISLPTEWGKIFWATSANHSKSMDWYQQYARSWVLFRVYWLIHQGARLGEESMTWSPSNLWQQQQISSTLLLDKYVYTHAQILPWQKKKNISRMWYV